MSGPPHLSHAAEEEVLGGLTTEALMEEVARRIECARKPERRTIFIGPRQDTKHTDRQTEHGNRAQNGPEQRSQRRCGTPAL